MHYTTTIDAPTIFAWFFSKTSTPIQILSLDHDGREVDIHYFNASKEARQLKVQLPRAKQPLFVSLYSQ